MTRETIHKYVIVRHLGYDRPEETDRIEKNDNIILVEPVSIRGTRYSPGEVFVVLEHNPETPLIKVLPPRNGRSFRLLLRRFVSLDLNDYPYVSVLVDDNPKKATICLFE